MSNRYAIGDIHGELDKLNECLRLAAFNDDTDLLVSVGDLCDRGPDSYGVVEKLMKIKNLTHVRGNHDQWFLEYLLNGDAKPMWIQQGGRETIDSYKHTTADDRKRHRDFYEASVFYHVIDDTCFVHGGFDRDFSIAGQDGVSLMWDRELVTEMMYCIDGRVLDNADGFGRVFIGHTPTIYWNGQDDKMITVPVERGGIVNIDTGSGKGGKLTVYNIDTGEYFQA